MKRNKKRKWYAVLSVFFYILFLAQAWGFNLTKLMDGKLFFQLLMGAFLLTLPFLEKKIGWEEILPIFGKKALEAGYIQTFLLLFLEVSDSGGEFGKNMVMHFRPVLYGLCLFLIFLQKEEQEQEQKKEPEVKEAEKEEKTFYSIPLNAYEIFRQKGLTKREAEIALLICKGCSNREIAEEFVISETTVKKHVSHIFEKTGIEKREELKSLCLKDGL